MWPLVWQLTMIVDFLLKHIIMLRLLISVDSWISFILLTPQKNLWKGKKKLNKNNATQSAVPIPPVKPHLNSVGSLSNRLGVSQHNTRVSALMWSQSSVHHAAKTLTLLVPLFLAPLRFWQSLWVSVLIFRVKWGRIFHIQALNRCHTPGMVISLLN